MEKKSKKKVMAIVAALVIVILVSVQGIILLLQKRQAGSQELSKVVNAESEEMLADTYEDATTNEKTNPSPENKIAKMAELSKDWDYTKVDAIDVQISETDTRTVKVPVPKGYKASKVTGTDEEKGENTLDGGLVIYEGVEEVTGKIGDENVTKAQKERNQWVWVPIYDPSYIYGTDANGKIWGKLYDFNDSGRIKFNWTEDENGMSIINSIHNREPDLLVKDDRDAFLPGYMLEEEREKIYKEITTNFGKTINSIKKYGGFYIGRYETGGLSGEAKVVKQNEDINNQNWYTMYEKSEALRGKNRNVETSMIWGCLWDATLQWLIDTNAITYDQVVTTPGEWGNYKDSTFTYTTDEGEQTKEWGEKLIPTGSSEYTKRNNIYDMGGNVQELTLETDAVPNSLDTNYFRITRGSTYVSRRPTLAISSFASEPARRLLYEHHQPCIRL